MTKKVNTPETPESGKKKTKNKIILEKKFNELTFEKKREYLYTVFGSIRGCTGFFDMRFTAGMPDYKTFDMGNGDMADVIIKDSGMYSDEGGGSEGDNSIIIIFQGKIYGGGKVRYYETNKIDKPHLDYQKIISCTRDKPQDEFIVMVECKDKSTKSISLNKGEKYDFEEELISKLRVPKELLQKEEEIKKLLQEKMSKKEKKLAEQAMYQKAVDIFVLKNNWEEVQRYINKPGVKLNEDQKKSYVEYLLNGRKRNHGDGMRREDMKSLLVFLKTFESQDYIKNICNEMLEKSVRRDSKDEIFESIKETANLGGFDIQDRYTKKIEHYCKRQGYFEEMKKCLLESGQDGKIRYKKYYDLHKPTDKIKLDTIAEATGENTEDLFKQSFLDYIEKLEKCSYSSIEYFLKIMKEKGYEKSLYGKVFDKIVPNNYESLWKYANSSKEVVNNIIEIRSHTDKKIHDDMLFELFRYTKEEDTEKLWNKISQRLTEEEKKSTLDMMIDKYLDEDKQICDLNLIINRGFNDTSKILKIFDKIVCKRYGCCGDKFGIDYCNRLISTLKNKKLLSKNNLLKQIHQIYKDKLDQFFQEGTVGCLIRSYPIHFDDKDFLEDVCDKLIQKSGDKFSSGSTIADGFVKIGFDQDRIQNFIKKYLGNVSVLYNLIEGFGLNIDKIRVNTLIEDFFQQGKVSEAERLSKVGGLYDLRKKKIISWKLENKKLDCRDAGRAIEEGGLDKSYYKYLIDIDISKGDIANALQLAEKYDLLISDEQFESYMEKKN